MRSKRRHGNEQPTANSGRHRTQAVEHPASVRYGYAAPNCECSHRHHQRHLAVYQAIDDMSSEHTRDWRIAPLVEVKVVLEQEPEHHRKNAEQHERRKCEPSLCQFWHRCTGGEAAAGPCSILVIHRFHHGRHTTRIDTFRCTLSNVWTKQSSFEIWRRPHAY